MPEKLETAALCKALGVTRRTVTAWLGKGCPSERRADERGRGGRPRHWFDLLEVKKWLVARGIAPRRLADDGALAGPDSEGDSAPGVGSEPASPGGEAPAKALGYDAMLERLKIAERHLFGKWVAAVNRGQPSDIAALSRIWIEHVEQLRKVEKDQDAVRRQREGWMSRSEHEAFCLRLATEIRVALLALPKSLAPQLAGLCPAEIEAALDGAVREVLNLVAESRCLTSER